MKRGRMEENQEADMAGPDQAAEKLRRSLQLRYLPGSPITRPPLMPGYVLPEIKQPEPETPSVVEVVGAVALAGAALAIVGVGAFIAHPFEDDPESSTPTTQPSSPQALVSGESIEFGRDEVLRLDIRVDSDEAELWTIYSANPQVFHDEIARELTNGIGSHTEFLVTFGRGSLITRLLAKVKSGFTRIKINIAVTAACVRKGVIAALAKVKAFLKSDGLRAFATGTGKVLKVTGTVLNVVLPLLTFFGLPDLSHVTAFFTDFGGT